ncbi:MAG: antitoxin [Steroidobacteraceae bacterium]
MLHKTAKLFANGGSQAVRLPAEFRFSGAEVHIRRDAITGEVILSPKAGGGSWAGFFALRDQVDVPPEFIADRPWNDPRPRDER